MTLPDLPLDALVLDALRLAVVVAAPLLAAVLVAAVLVGLVQAWLNVHDVAVAAAPRWFVGVAAVAAFGGWMARHLVDFAVMAWGGGL